MRYDAVLFDNDGVLTRLTGRDVLRDAVLGAFADEGVDSPPKEHVEELLVGVTPDAVRSIAQEHDLDPDSFWERRDRYATRAQQRLVERGEKPLYDDVDAIFDIPLDRGIISSNQHPTIESILAHNDLEEHFDTYYGREMSVEGLQRKKPATYYLDRAVDDLGADRPVSVGDSESDVVAAQNAGMDAVFVRRGHRRDLDLSVKPTAEVPSLRELPAVLNGER